MREGIEKEIIDSTCKKIYEAIESAKDESAKELEIKNGTRIKADEVDSGDLLMTFDGELISLRDCVQHLAFDLIESYGAVKHGEKTKEESNIDFQMEVLDSVSNALAASRNPK